MQKNDYVSPCWYRWYDIFVFSYPRNLRTFTASSVVEQRSLLMHVFRLRGQDRRWIIVCDDVMLMMSLEEQRELTDRHVNLIYRTDI